MPTTDVVVIGGGTGCKLSPVVGEMLADLATGDRQCPIDPGIFRLSRFTEGPGLSGSYPFGIVG